MTLITYLEAPAYVIDTPWNTGEFTVGAYIPGVVDGGETGREARSSQGDTLRLSVRFSSIVSESRATIRNAFQSMGNAPVFCPLWPALRNQGDSHPLSAAYWAVFQNGVLSGVYDTASIPGGLTADQFLIPLLIGRLSERPRCQMVTDESFVIDWDFTEATALAITLAALTNTDGPVVGGVTPPILPIRPQWSITPEASMPDVRMEHRKIGSSRVASDAYFDQPAFRTEQQGFRLVGNDAWSFLSFFLERGGTTKPFWIEGTLSDVRQTADAWTGETSLSVNPPTARGSNQFFMLTAPAAREPIKVTANGVGSWTLAAALAGNWPQSTTQIRSMILSRFSQSRIDLTFVSPGIAETRAVFRELPWELSNPSGDTTGVTHGSLNQTAFTYAFTIPYPSGDVVYRYTSAERNVSDGSNTWTSKPMVHGEIRSALNLERQTVDITTDAFSGNPLALFIPFALEWPMKVEICEVAVSGSTASNSRCLFYGEIDFVEQDGPYIRATASALGAALDRRILSKLHQPTCVWMLFQTECGVSKAAWEYLASVVSTSGVSITINTITLGGGAVGGLNSHWFAGGYAVFGSGSSSVTRRIADSTSISGGSMTITLATQATVANGTAVKLYPGCDRLYETCLAKFNNQIRFGGTPHIPIGNPSMIKISKDLSSGGKK